TRTGVAHTAGIGDDFVDWFAIAGPPDVARDRLQQLAKLGLDFCHIIPGSTGMPREVAVSSVQRLAHEGLPALRGQGSKWCRRTPDREGDERIRPDPLGGRPLAREGKTPARRGGMASGPKRRWRMKQSQQLDPRGDRTVQPALLGLRPPGGGSMRIWSPLLA